MSWKKAVRESQTKTGVALGGLLGGMHADTAPSEEWQRALSLKGPSIAKIVKKLLQIFSKN